MGPWHPAMRVGPGGHRVWADTCDHVQARVQAGREAQCIRMETSWGGMLWDRADVVAGEAMTK